MPQCKNAQSTLHKAKRQVRRNRGYSRFMWSEKCSKAKTTSENIRRAICQGLKADREPFFLIDHSTTNACRMCRMAQSTRGQNGWATPRRALRSIRSWINQWKGMSSQNLHRNHPSLQDYIVPLYDFFICCMRASLLKILKKKSWTNHGRVWRKAAGMDTNIRSSYYAARVEAKLGLSTR